MPLAVSEMRFVSGPTMAALSCLSIGAVEPECVGGKRPRSGRSKAVLIRKLMYAVLSGAIGVGVSQPPRHRCSRRRNEINVAFATFVRERPNALFVRRPHKKNSFTPLPYIGIKPDNGHSEARCSQWRDRRWSIAAAKASRRQGIAAAAAELLEEGQASSVIPPAM